MDRTAAITPKHLRVLARVLQSATMLLEGVCGELFQPTEAIPTGPIPLDANSQIELKSVFKALAEFRGQQAILETHLAAIKACSTAVNIVPGPPDTTIDATTSCHSSDVGGYTIVQEIGRGDEPAYKRKKSPSSKIRKKGDILKSGAAKVACSGNDEKLVDKQPVIPEEGPKVVEHLEMPNTSSRGRPNMKHGRGERKPQG
jgi:hypothetical protein